MRWLCLEESDLFFSGEGVGEKKKNTQEWTIMDLKIEGGEECSVGEEGKRGVCLHRADLCGPTEVPEGRAASLPRGGGEEGKESGVGSQGPPRDGEMSRHRVLWPRPWLHVGVSWEGTYPPRV